MFRNAEIAQELTDNAWQAQANGAQYSWASIECKHCFRITKLATTKQKLTEKSGQKNKQPANVLFFCPDFSVSFPVKWAPPDFRDGKPVLDFAPLLPMKRCD